MQYHDAGAFVSDVRLIFENAKKYNPPKHPIHIAAAKLSKVRVCLFFLHLLYFRFAFRGLFRRMEHVLGLTIDMFAAHVFLVCVKSGTCLRRLSSDLLLQLTSR